MTRVRFTSYTCDNCGKTAIVTFNHSPIDPLDLWRKESGELGDICLCPFSSGTGFAITEQIEFNAKRNS